MSIDNQKDEIAMALPVPAQIHKVRVRLVAEKRKNRGTERTDLHPKADRAL